ncbi:MAG: glycosyltransferase [Candidatus Electrothrix sp. AU1_5]|nr:glycosyltransferase [Candidatus Electrothrix gigas]
MSHQGKSNRRILIYLDSVVFGGHEVTLLEAIQGLAEESEIDLYILAPQSNRQLLDRLKELKNIQIIIHGLQTVPGDIFRVLCKTGKVRRLTKMIVQYQPDFVIVSQGAIALSACGLGAARTAGVPLMSFLPMAHPVALVRGKNSLPVRIQEVLYQRLYALPDYFFTICTTAKDQLQKQYGVASERIFVSYFGLETEHLPQPDASCQIRLDRKKHLALIGRIEFQQKRHDFFMRHLAKFRAELPSLTVHVIGDGPDRNKLEKLVHELNLQDMVTFEGWTDNMAAWYKKLDMLLLPSRFEGVPVVMLEAMHWKIPIVASQCDGMTEMLPEEWLFPVNDGEKMIRCMKETLEHDQERYLRRNRELVAKLDTASFRRGFRNAVLSCLKREKL